MREAGRPPRRRLPGSRRALVYALKGGVGLLLGAAVLLWAWVGLGHLSRLPYFQITQVAVRGNTQVGTAQILGSLGLRPGANILEPDLAELRRRLLANPWIREAWVSRRLPPSLEVVVSERTPEIVVAAEGTYLAAGDGVILAEAAGMARRDLPRLVLGGGRHAPGETVPGEVVPRALALWRVLAEFAAPRGERLQEIRPERDGTFTVRTQRGVLLRARGEDAERQLRRLAAALRHAGTSLHAYEAVDLRFEDRVVLRVGT